jgi:potassium-transporting ATPase KdpC subunit
VSSYNQPGVGGGASRSRRAKGRNVAPQKVSQLVENYTEGRGLGVFGEPRVNVLKLNLALDRNGG